MENFDKVIEACVSKLNRKEPFNNMGWGEIVDYLGLDYHPDNLRKGAYFVKKYNDYLNSIENNSVSNEELYEKNLKKEIEIKKMATKISDMRNLVNRMTKEQSRFESMLECARDIAKDFNQSKPLLSNPPIIKSGDKEGLLLISDWHIGLECSNHWNKFNTEIAKERLSFLKQRVIDICLHNDVNKINVCCCGDLISGIIHNNLRLENRENVVQQSILVVEMISELLTSLSTLFKVDFYYVVGNHERISANKNDSLDKENFGYFILEMIKYRCSNLMGLTIHENIIDDEIITFNIFDDEIVVTHGNNFGNLNTYIPKLTSMLGYVPDYVCVGHLHQHVEKTYGKTELIVNPSFSGVDSYAKNYGLVGKVGQKLMIFSKEYGKECTYNIDVERR